MKTKMNKFENVTWLCRKSLNLSIFVLRFKPPLKSNQDTEIDFSHLSSFCYYVKINLPRETDHVKDWISEFFVPQARCCFFL